MPDIEIYTSPFCGYCGRAKGLLDSKGVAYREIDTFMNGGKRREMSERAGGATSVPQIFIDGIHIGDSDKLQSLEAKGELDALLGLAEG